MGDKPQLTKSAGNLTDLSQTRYVAATIMAEVMTGLSEHYEALGWLKRAMDERVGALMTFRVDPGFEQLRTQPGCQQLLGRLNSELLLASYCPRFRIRSCFSFVSIWRTQRQFGGL
jgi:hypothetical protein